MQVELGNKLTPRNAEGLPNFLLPIPNSMSRLQRESEMPALTNRDFFKKVISLSPSTKEKLHKEVVRIVSSPRTTKGPPGSKAIGNVKDKEFRDQRVQLFTFFPLLNP